ncbi:MAG: molybdopterin cofactor-binding domain-containing protein [Myxococcaceae bacterium]
MNALSRRSFLKSSALSGASLVIAFYVPRRAEAMLLAGGPKRPLPAPNAFLRIAKDGSVTVQLAHSEMGQSIWTTLPMLVAEELECDWSSVRVETAPAAPAYFHTGFGMQMTGGSSTTWSEFDRYRTVGAMAREMLVRAAAERWKVDAKTLHVENGFVINGQQRLAFADLAEAAQALTPPTTVALKPASEWKLIGKPMHRLDTPQKISGKAQFGIDVQFPGLRTALVARPPVFGGKVKSFDATKAKAVPGVEAVVQVPSGVAVVASNFWAARTGRDALEVQWDLGPGAEVDTHQLLQSFKTLATKPGAVVLQKGAADAALAKASRRLLAEYDVPYLAHAAMEPLNCTVRLEKDRCDIWVGTQFQTNDQAVAAKLTGLSPDKVSIHTTFLGGGFGRRANPSSDFVAEAVNVAKASGLPVKVQWTREDDTQGGFYRPLFLHRVEVGVNAKGFPLVWKHTVVGQSLLAGTPFEAMVKNGIDESSVEGVADSPYLHGVATKLVTLHSPRTPVPVLWWRSVGNTHTAFAMESMVDELAHAAHMDPLSYRIQMLQGQPRQLAVLQLAAKKAGWGKPLPAGTAQGLAVHASFGSIVAQVAEVSVDKDKGIHVTRVVCAVDCGLAVNPLSLEAQVQGSVAFGLGPTLHSALTLKEGRVQESNFSDYVVLRLNEMPKVEVYILPSKGKMGGIGEPATAPINAAVANAVFALTGQRLRSLPLKLA